MFSIIFDKYLQKLRMKHFWTVLFFCFGIVGLSFAQQSNFEKVASKHFKNMYKINDVLYRSEQPSKKGFKELEAKGILTILNLRRLKEDTKKAKSTNLKLEHIPIKTKVLNEFDIVKALQIIKNSKEPVLVHCWHGSDRTGTIIAAYRIVFENWSKKRAIKEFTNAKFGYHKNMYPNLLDLLENLDVASIKKQLNL